MNPIMRFSYIPRTGASLLALLALFFIGLDAQAQSSTSVFSKTIYLSEDKSTVFPNTSHYCYEGCDTFESQLQLTESDFPSLSGVAVRSIVGGNISASDILFTVNGFFHCSKSSYWYPTPSVYRPIWSSNYTKNEETWEACHQLVQHSATRKLIIENAISAVVRICSLLPQDFTDRVISEANYLLGICPKIQSVDVDDFDCHSYNFWVGFMVRRHFNDMVPVFEMEAALKTLISKLQTPNSPKKPSTFYSYSVNNSIAIDWKQSQLQIRKPGSTSIKSLSYGITELKKITCLKDSTGTYYLLEFFEWDGGQWVEKKTLFSDQLEVVY